MESCQPPSADLIALIGQVVTDDFLNRLSYYALNKLRQRNWRGIWGGPLSGGVVAEDLAMDAIHSVLTGARNWNPSRDPDLLKFLCDVIDSKVSHLVERPENTLERSTFPAEGESEADFLDRKFDRSTLVAVDETISNDIERTNEALLAALFEEVKDDPLLVQILAALQEGVSKRVEIAGRLGVTPGEITQASKRLERRLPAFRKKYAYMNPFGNP